MSSALNVRAAWAWACERQFANCAGVPGIGSMKFCVAKTLNEALVTALLSSALMRAITAAGVFAGAYRPQNVHIPGSLDSQRRGRFAPAHVACSRMNIRIPRTHK